jgi:hypothetical protein
MPGHFGLNPLLMYAIKQMPTKSMSLALSPMIRTRHLLLSPELLYMLGYLPTSVKSLFGGKIIEYARHYHRSLDNPPDWN